MPASASGSLSLSKWESVGERRHVRRGVAAERRAWHWGNTESRGRGGGRGPPSNISEGQERLIAGKKSDRPADAFYVVWKMPPPLEKEKKKEGKSLGKRAAITSATGVRRSVCSPAAELRTWDSSLVSPGLPENPAALLVGSLTSCIPQVCHGLQHREQDNP